MVPPTVAGQDPERFVRLFIEEQRAILRYILALVPDVNNANEIFQETAVNLWRKFDRDTSSPSPHGPVDSRSAAC